MACCGNKRTALTAEWAYVRAQKRLYQPAAIVPEIQAPRKTSNIVLKYLGHGSLSIRGPSTGLVYYFAGQDQTTVINEDDSEALLRTGLFSREEDLRTRGNNAFFSTEK
jgi:hypothetical protein